MYLCDKGSILVLPIEYVKKIIKERMFTMNLKNKKIFSRIAAGVMTVAMAITLLPGTMKTVNAAEPVTSASLDVILYKRAEVYAPNTTFKFTVKKLTADKAIEANKNEDLIPAFKDAPADGVTAVNGATAADGVTAAEITLTPTAGELDATSINRTLTFTLDPSKFPAMGTYRYEVTQTKGTYEGITYDEDVKYLDVTVAVDDTNGNSYIESAQLISYKTGTRDKSGSFVNTYGVKPNPTNPDPDGTVNDLVISKKVTGNFGDRNKKFDFEITINGAEGENYYLEKLTGAPVLSKQTIISKGEKVTIKLGDGESVKIYGLTKGDTYTIKELATDGADDYKTTFETKLNGTNKAGGSGNIKTATGTIDAGTSLQTQEVAFTNDRTGSATGFVSSYGPYALMVVLAGAVAFVLFRKRRAEY